jgi:hypothetical protein
VSTISGIPAHALLVHAMVVFAPLTALLEVLCALWPAARQRLVWLVLAFAAFTLVLTPLTTSAGEWVYNREENPREIVIEHANRGSWMLVFSVALFIVAIALAVLHWLESRSDKPRKALAVLVAVLAVVVGAASTIAVVRIGESGAEAIWGRET